MMAGMARIGIVDREFHIGDWSRGPNAHGGRAPHYFQGVARRDPINQFRVQWKDAHHNQPEAVLDYDGCRAPILGPVV